MKLTKSTLKQIIKEEIQRLNEAPIKTLMIDKSKTKMIDKLLDDAGFIDPTEYMLLNGVLKIYKQDILNTKQLMKKLDQYILVK
jgi:hypothetical protein